MTFSEYFDAAIKMSEDSPLWIVLISILIAVVFIIWAVVGVFTYGLTVAATCAYTAYSIHKKAKEAQKK